MNKFSKTYLSIKQCYSEVLNGTLLAIDPSTGSISSRPGFALFEKGQLVESGEILVNNLKDNRSQRLYEIGRTIREELPKPDVIAVEYIPPITYRGKGHGMNSVAIMALQKAIGAIIGAVPCDWFLEIPASAWKKYKPEDYVKSDQKDAECIGTCVIEIAKIINSGKK